MAANHHTLSSEKKPESVISIEAKNNPSLFSGERLGAPLRARMNESHHKIREHVLSMGAGITPRTGPVLGLFKL